MEQANTDFMSISNFEMLLKVFQQYMQKEQNITVQSESLPGIKQNMFKVMKKLKASSPSTPLKTLNNVVLNEVRDMYLDENNITPSKKPVIRTLSRDQDLYGNREVVTSQIKPALSSNTREDTVLSFDRVLAQRSEDREQVNNTALPFSTIKEDTITPDILTQKLKSFEEDRLKTSVELNQQQRDIATQDPKTIFKHFDDALKQTSQKLQPRAMIDSAKNDAFENSASSFVIPSNQIQRDITRYVMFNGYDRRWDVYPKRFSFSLETDDLNSSLRNIVELRVTKLIIPLEVDKKRLNDSDSQQTRPITNFRFGLNVPYLILSIAEVQGMYDGLNEAVKRSTTTFVYDTSYTTQTGRGFLIMSPIQDEARIFYPNPMGLLPKMSFSVLRPNGTTFNMSADDNAVTAISYLPIDVNKIYLRIFTKRFFDKDEININDTILFKKFALPTVSEFITQLQNEVGRTPSESEQDMYGKGLSQVENFLNRIEGHEVQSLGIATTAGLYKEFVIFIPRVLNTISGEYEIDNSFANTLNVILGNTTSSTLTNFSKITLTTDSPLLNMSLQVSIAMTIKTATADIPGLQAVLA